MVQYLKKKKPISPRARQRGARRGSIPPPCRGTRSFCPAPPPPRCLRSHCSFVPSAVRSPRCSSFPSSSSCPCRHTRRPVSRPLVPPSVSTPHPPREQLLAAAVVGGSWWCPGGQPLPSSLLLASTPRACGAGGGLCIVRSFLGPGTRQLHEKEGKNLQETSASTSPRPSFPLPSSFVLLPPLCSPFAAGPSLLPSFPLFVRSPCSSFSPLLALPVVLVVSMSYPSLALLSFPGVPIR